MALREVIAKPVIGILGAAVVIGVILDFWLLWDRDNQELWDKIVGTVVVNDRSGQTLPSLNCGRLAIAISPPANARTGG